MLGKMGIDIIITNEVYAFTDLFQTTSSPTKIVLVPVETTVYIIGAQYKNYWQF
jgi:hypothetical protein